MLSHRKHLGFSVEVVDSRGGVATKNQAKTPVLDKLQSTEGRCGEIWVSYRRRIIDDGSDERLICSQQTLLIHAKLSIGEGSQHI